MEPHELEALADRLAIEDLLTRYAHAVDRHDWDLYRSVFTDDAHIDYTSAGGIAGTLDEAVSFSEAPMPISNCARAKRITKKGSAFSKPAWNETTAHSSAGVVP